MIESNVVKRENAGYQYFLPFPTCLTHYHTMPHFDALTIYSSGKHCEKKRNCL